MSQPRITALINTYNYGRFIEEALESVLAQDFPAAEMEILVVDDGSTDDTRDRVAKFGGRVRYFWKSNGGQSSAVNLGYEQAHGKIIALLDADDVWLPQKVRRVVETFDRHPGCGLVLHKRSMWDGPDGLINEDPDLPVLSGAFPPTSEDLLRYGTTSTSALTFRKQAASQLFPIPEGLRLLTDSYLQALLLLSTPVAILNEPLTKYRLHASNLFHFAETDAARVHLRSEATTAFFRETRAWLGAHGFNIRSPELAAYLARFELIEQANRFQAKGARRLEFFRHLRLHRKVYAPLWTRRYRAFRIALECLALALGYRAFSSLRVRSAQAGLPKRREEWAPARAAPSFGADLRKATP